MNFKLTNVSLFLKFCSIRLTLFANNFRFYIVLNHARHFFFWSLVLWTTSCSKHDKEATYNHYCGSCHLVPKITSLPKSIWLSSVLPNMGARMGIKSPNYDPLDNVSSGSQYALMHRIYPKEQLIPTEHWERIVEYVSENAPETLVYDYRFPLETTSMFKPKPLVLDTTSPAFTTSIFVKGQTMKVGTVNGNLHIYDIETEQTVLHPASNSAISQISENGPQTLLLEMGKIHPHDEPKGSLSSLSKAAVKEQLLNNLQRPVFALDEDLDGDGHNEIVVCEFGNQTGKLSLFVNQGEETVKKTLLSIPGSIKVIARDMNDDGKKDLIVLTSQGTEGLWILTQQAPLVFDAQRVIPLAAVFGSSGFDLVDFNKDGLMDVAIVNGDNADLSMVTKPYHGLTLFQNMGGYQFKKIKFLAIPGATNVISSDFDQDGDIDFIVSAFFPDEDLAPGYSLIYLSNQAKKNTAFKMEYLPLSNLGKWLILTKADFDQDGDDDFAVGSFVFSAKNPSEDYLSEWGFKSPDIMLYENIYTDPMPQL